MRLDTKALRYLTTEDWRVLTAVEQGSRNHEVVPTPLIAQLAKLRAGAGAAHKCISTLAKANLIARLKNARYDGYRLTYGGLDYLALHTHAKAGAVYSVGNQIGTGKESDVFVCAAAPGQAVVAANATKGARTAAAAAPPADNQHQLVLKIHRLGRISFRTVKANRDYLRKRNSGSWMYMSRLAALKEHVFMSALHEAGFPVPRPIAQNRHTVVMELIDAFPLRQIAEVPDPQGLYAELMQMIVDLAGVGLIHGDFNEFNILVREEQDGSDDESSEQLPSEQELSNEESSEHDPKLPFPTQTAPSTSTSNPKLRLTPILIDFPQMLSTSHTNAEMYFDRDVSCVKRFFARRFGFTSDDSGPHFVEAMHPSNTKGKERLDVKAEASGFSRKMNKELEGYMVEVGAVGDGEGGGEGEMNADGRDEDDDEDEDDVDDEGVVNGDVVDEYEDGEEKETSKSHITTNTGFVPDGHLEADVVQSTAHLQIDARS